MDKKTENKTSTEGDEIHGNDPNTQGNEMNVKEEVATSASNEEQDTPSNNDNTNGVTDKGEEDQSSTPSYGKDDGKPDYDDIQVSPELIESMTAGFTEKFMPSLEKNRKTINQIKSSQAVLIETVQQENAKFEECQANQGLDKTMTKAKAYHAKLLRLRKDMTTLYEKSAKLKKRALRLQQQKQKEEMTRAQQMEVEYEKEKMLTARVATGSPEKET